MELVDELVMLEERITILPGFGIWRSSGYAMLNSPNVGIEGPSGRRSLTPGDLPPIKWTPCFSSCHFLIFHRRFVPDSRVQPPMVVELANVMIQLLS